MLPTNRQGATDSHFIVISLDFLILKIGYGSRERGTRRIEIRSLVTTSIHRISIVKTLLIQRPPLARIAAATIRRTRAAFNYN
jgi:hypothetical protein